MVASARSLLGVYTAAEKARKAKMELQKIVEEEQKLKDLEFYRGLAQRNMAPQQLEALRTAYHSQGPWTASPPSGLSPGHRPISPREQGGHASSQPLHSP